MKNVTVVLVVVFLGAAITYAFATANPYVRATYQEGDSQTKACLMYGLQSDGTLYPVLVNGSGAVKTF